MVVKFFIIFSLSGISMLNGFLLFKNRYDELHEGNRNSAPIISPSVREAEFNQKLDHFNQADKRMWKQLYFYKDDYYYPGGPVYLWIWVGESDTNWLEEEYWNSHAKKNRGFLFLLEHRFYGKSQPLGDTATANLRFLNASQALADVASFIKEMNQQWEFPEDTKWIMFGNFYGGSLAAWMRLQYPDLVYGAVASSAPVQAKVDFSEYLNSVSDIIASCNKQCQEDIKNANQKIDDLVVTEEGRKQLTDTFKLCTPLKNDKLDISFFVTNMADLISSDIHFDRWGRHAIYDCEKMLKNSDKKKPLDRYADLVLALLDLRREQCVPSNSSEYFGHIKRSDVMSATESNRVWIYQLCSQFGWFTTTGKKSKTFSKHINLNYFVNLCSKVFNSSFDLKYISNEVKKTNSLFRGSNIDIPRIIFVHGSTDPFSSVGITTTKNKKHVDVVIVEGGSYCSEQGKATRCHPKAKKEAQNKIMSIIDSWL